jgi:hypothetical protein
MTNEQFSILFNALACARMGLVSMLTHGGKEKAEDALQRIDPALDLLREMSEAGPTTTATGQIAQHPKGANR